MHLSGHSGMAKPARKKTPGKRTETAQQRLIHYDLHAYT